MARDDRFGHLPGGARDPDRLDSDPVLPRRSHAGVQPQRADPGMVDLQVAPEQAGQGTRQAAQRRMVDRRLAFPQVVDDQGADRLAGDRVTIHQLGGGQLPLRSEHPDRGRRRGREDAQLVQQLVEVRAGVPAASGEGVQQFQAVADGDSGGRAALGRQDHGDPPHRQVLSGRAGRVGPRQRGERGEAAGIAGPGHLGREVLRGIRDDQPRQAGPDHIAADQREHPTAKSNEIGPGAGCRPSSVAKPCRGQVPPRQVARGVGATGHPSLLPGAAGLLLEPVHELGQADPAAGLQAVPAGGERGREQPRQHVAAPLAARRPVILRRAWREPLRQS
ncbi:MAG: hypothetical protein ACRD0H_21995 [Actinomycetes bacterium]